MRPAGPAAAHDLPTALAAYLVIAAAALLLAAFPHYAPALPSLLQALVPIGNGLAGGAVAGSVAIAVYRIGRRSKSREKKFLSASALVAELHKALEAVPPAATPAPARERRAVAGTGPSPDQDPQAGRPPRPLPDVPRRVYEGLVSSGALFQFDPTLQMRLHMFYEYVERGNREALGRMIPPLTEDVAVFWDANAPFKWSCLAWLPLCALSGLRRRRRGPARDKGP